METRRSSELFEEASTLIPGGVNSPVRAFKGVGGTPPFIARAQGAYLWDADGNRYLDAVGSWGPMILGHARDEIVKAVQHAAAGGTSFGAPTEGEVRLAETVLARLPQFDRIRFVNSGTEATMSALRVARAVTDRPLVLKFAGNYHGHSDGLLVNAGSGLLTTGRPSSAGVPDQVADLTLVAPYNDLAALHELLEARGGDLAAIIFEPVVGNMGVVEPQPEFLDALQAARSNHGVLLVADEVMSGFRVARGGALERYGIKADLQRRSWISSPLWAPCTRRARCRAIRSPWPPVKPPLKRWTPWVTCTTNLRRLERVWNAFSCVPLSATQSPW
jgi:glutamate-1-semialdehyde 2,1-aminomutase